MLAVHSDTRILYALKVVPKAKITTQKQVEQILAESRILKYAHMHAAHMCYCVISGCAITESWVLK